MQKNIDYRIWTEDGEWHVQITIYVALNCIVKLRHVFQQEADAMEWRARMMLLLETTHVQVDVTYERDKP